MVPTKVTEGTLEVSQADESYSLIVTEEEGVVSCKKNFFVFTPYFHAFYESWYSPSMIPFQNMFDLFDFMIVGSYWTNNFLVVIFGEVLLKLPHRIKTFNVDLY